MITYEEAQALVLTQISPLASESVPLADAVGRVLAEDVRADVDVPPFDKAAMDGFACRRSDLGSNAKPVELEILEEIAAGTSPTKALRPGTCARVLTGAPVPPGADCVVMQELAVRQGSLVRFTATKTADNISRAGEDLRIGDLVLRSGTRISPAAVAALATVGVSEPRVALRPRVAILATGSELVEPNRTPGPAQIRNSNGPLMLTQARAVGASAAYHGLVCDDEVILTHAIEKACAEADVLLLSGGSSTGDFDLVPGALRNLGFRFAFDSVAMQPGRPTIFARKDHIACFGLPGNPVATFVVFELLVQPYLLKMMGHDFVPTEQTAKLNASIRRRKVDRQSAIPVHFVGPSEVAPIEYHGSAHITAMNRADGLVIVPRGVFGFDSGDMVRVRLLST